MPGPNSTAARRRARDIAFQLHAKPVLAHPERWHPLRVARVSAGLTQAELGLIAHLTPTRISEIERGAVAIASTTKAALADALELEESDLFVD